MAKLKLGETVRDRVTGFEGTLVGYAEYLSGQVSWQVQPKIGVDGKWADARWVEQTYLRLANTDTPLGFCVEVKSKPKGVPGE